MPSVADFIEKHHAQLVQRYAEEAGKLESARGLSSYELTNTFPEYLDTLAAISRQGHRGDPAKTKRRLEETHLSLRLRLGYNQEEVTSEYSTMGRLIAGLWAGLPREQQPPPEDTALLFAELQGAMDATIEFFSGYSMEDRQREKRTLRRLDSMAPKLLERSRGPVLLREQLMPLVELIQDAMKAEGAALYLAAEDGRGLVTVAATGSCSGQPAGLEVVPDPASFLGQVSVSEEPLHLADASTAAQATIAGLYATGLRSVLGLRLWPHGELLGVLYVGLAEMRSFEPQALRYFETLVEYLSGIIDRGLLFGRLSEANTQLREGEERWRLFVQGIQDYATIYMLDPKGRIISWNPGAERFEGYRAEEVLGKDVGVMFYPEEERARGEPEAHLSEAAARGRLSVEGWRVRNKAPSPFWAEMTLIPHRDVSGRLRGFTKVTRDLSERHRAEQERTRAQEALARSEREFRTLAESMPQIVWTGRPDGKVDYVNQRLSEYSGKSTEELLRTGWQGIVHPDTLPVVEAAWARARATGEPYQVEQHLRRKDGVYRWHLTRGLPAQDEHGRVIRWLGTSTDIDDIKRTEAELRQRATFEQQIVGIVSHDLRNPLNAITLSAQALLRGDELTERQAKSVARLISASERATRLTRDLLDFTQARLGGGIPIERKPLDFHAAVQLMLEEVQAAHPERVIDFRSAGEGQGAWDGDRLAQVVTNLVNNALTYSPQGTPVQVETRGEGGEVLLRVHNEGSPIPAELLPQLFEPMRRGTEQGSAGRSIGLGLFIVDNIIRAHGGRIKVSSAEGAGTTFTVHLPRS